MAHRIDGAGRSANIARFTRLHQNKGILHGSLRTVFCERLFVNVFYERVLHQLRYHRRLCVDFLLYLAPISANQPQLRLTDNRKIAMPEDTQSEHTRQKLAQQTCIPCSGSLPRATSAEIAQLHRQVPQWEVIQVGEVSQIQREYRFANFQQALAFTNRVGAIAEEMNHHPALLTEWGKVTVTWWTHAIKGLHQNDFVMAVKTDEIADAL
jgi:4a-hydroxytetrahydrobiopterin dehydratase